MVKVLTVGARQNMSLAQHNVELLASINQFQKRLKKRQDEPNSDRVPILAPPTASEPAKQLVSDNASVDNSSGVSNRIALFEVQKRTQKRQARTYEGNAYNELTF